MDDLHRRYRRDVVDYCVRHLRSREEGEDAAQTVFLNAYRSLAKGTNPQYERAWLFAITEHVVSHRRRTNSRRLHFEVPVDSDDLEYLGGGAPSPDDAPDLSGLADVLSDMPPLERGALVLRELRGLTYKEVAIELGVSGAVVETLLARGRRRLADRMQDLRRTGKRALGLCLPWSPLQSLFGSGAAVKGVAGLASVAIFAAAIPLHQAVTKAPAHAHAVAASHAVTAHALLPAGDALRPRARRFAPVHAVSRPTHSRASSSAGPAAPQPSPTIPAESPASPAPVVTSSPPPADVGVSQSQPGSEAAAAPAADISGSAPDTAAPDTVGPPAGPPGQLKSSLAPDPPAGPPPTIPQDARGAAAAAAAGKGSSADHRAAPSR